MVGFCGHLQVGFSLIGVTDVNNGKKIQMTLTPLLLGIYFQLIPYHSRCGMVKVPSSSKAVGVDYRPKC